ncbi:MAG: hypothetical protein RL477_1638 [Pseudomonadota bacterium]|jgi:hypothetical protein
MTTISAGSARFLRAWQRLEQSGPQPRHMRQLKLVPFKDMIAKIRAAEDAFVTEFTASLYGGDFYLLKGAFDPAFLKGVIRRVFDFGLSVAPSFHKMLDGTPDFHRIIDDGSTVDYSLRALRHGYYFYRFNDDATGVYRDFSPVWRSVKTISGLEPDAFENNLPHDGTVDRIVVYCYPFGGGNLKAHIDPTNNHKTTTGVMMSTRGVDYESGGFYCIDEAGKPIDLEPEIEAGDMFIFYPTLEHGVLPVDLGKPTDWKSPSGRWFLGVSSVDSDHVSQRVTGQHLAYGY